VQVGPPICKRNKHNTRNWAPGEITYVTCVTIANRQICTCSWGLSPFALATCALCVSCASCVNRPICKRNTCSKCNCPWQNYMCYMCDLLFLNSADVQMKQIKHMKHMLRLHMAGDSQLHLQIGRPNYKCNQPRAPPRPGQAPA
jgi:hypothetical protein